MIMDTQKTLQEPLWAADSGSIFEAYEYSLSPRTEGQNHLPQRIAQIILS